MSENKNSETFKELISNGLIPKDSRQLSTEEIQESCIVSDRFLELLEDERIRSNKSVIADDALIVSKDSKGVFTLDSNDYLWRTSLGNRILTQCKITDSGNKKARIPVSTTTLISSNNLLKEEIYMATDPMAKLEALSKNVKGGTVNAVTTTTTGGATKISKEERIAENKAIKDQLTKNIANVTLGNSIEVRTFNQKHGSLIAHVVVSDSLVKASVTKGPVMVEGKKQLKSGLSAKIVEDYNAGKPVPKDSYLEEYKLSLKEAAPTTPRGTIFTIPKGGYVSLDEFRKNESVKFDAENKDLITLALPKDTAMFSILTYFGGVIKEDPRTHGELAGTLKVESSVTPKDGTPKTTFKYIPSTRKRVVIPGNYIPQKVYKKVTLESAVNGDEAIKQSVNKSLFFNLFTEKGKHSELANEYQELIAKDGENYTSKFINEGKATGIVSYLDKTPIANPMIPIKEFNPSKDGTKELGKYIAYNILKPEEELSSLSPEVSSEYKVIREALGKMSIAEAVKSCIKTKPRNNEAASKVTLNSDDAIKALLQKAEGKSAGLIIDSAFDKDALNDIYSLVADCKY